MNKYLREILFLVVLPQLLINKLIKVFDFNNRTELSLFHNKCKLI